MSQSEPSIVRSNIVDEFANATDLFGLRSNLGRVYGALYLSDGSISFPEIVERSDCTRSAVTDALETLERMQLAEVDTATDGEEYVVAERTKDIDRVVVEDLPPLMRKEAKDVLVPLYEAEEHLDAAESSETKRRYEERLQELIDYFETQQMIMAQLEEMSEAELKGMASMFGLSLE